MTSKFLERSYSGESYSLHFIDEGPLDAPIVLCLHGGTRNASEFNALRPRLSQDLRVVCLDVVGRGKSGWVSDKSLYHADLYMADLKALLDHLDAEQVGVIGCSFGGLLGMSLAAEQRCWALTLIDAGAVVDQRYGAQIGQALAADPSFPTLEAARPWVAKLIGDPGHLTESQWRELVANSCCQSEDGRWKLAFDPGISHNFFLAAQQGIELTKWREWEAITCPTLLVRGERSRMFPEQLLQAMRERARMPLDVKQLADCGHCPHLVSEDRVELVASWFFDHAPAPAGQ